MDFAYSPTSFCRIFGLTEARKQLRQLPQEAIEAFGDAAYLTAQLIVSRARQLAPIRRTPVGTYRGGALRERLAAERYAKAGDAVVGIEKGLLVVRRGGRQTWVTRQRHGQRARIVVRGKRKGFYRKEDYKMLLRWEERDKVRAKGSLIVQPTKYGHFSEIGRGGRRGTGGARPWLRPAIDQSQDYFLGKMRDAAKASEQHLAAMGYRR